MTRRLAAFARFTVACVLTLGVASPLIGEASSGSSKGSSKKAASPKSGGQKSVHVKEYKKKDGTRVAAHDRKAPEAKAAKAPKPAKASAASTQPRDAKGRFIRSGSAKHTFQVQTGYPHGRTGYVVDHIRPLACGGSDTPSNMQWQTVAEGKAKDKIERVGCR
jgi:hypothetical protein